jgi:hypothetical protein
MLAITWSNIGWNVVGSREHSYLSWISLEFNSPHVSTRESIAIIKLTGTIFCCCYMAKFIQCKLSMNQAKVHWELSTNLYMFIPHPDHSVHDHFYISFIYKNRSWLKCSHHLT